VLAISSDTLTGTFFFDTNSQAAQATQGQALTDVQKRTADYFRFLLYATAIFSIIRYSSGVSAFADL
jgi:hypothetical protein